MNPTPEEQYARLVRGAVTVTTGDELKKRLASGKPLRVKLGVDPSSADIHLGHTVVLRKLRQFQDEGHQGVLIIGDFTGLVGDPTGRSKTRPQLTPEQVDENAKTYIDQVGKVLDVSRLEIVRNSQWLKPLTLYQLIGLSSKMTVAQFLERDDFQKRYRGGIPIGIHEFLYLMMQAYDSVQVKADVELGGTDQTFNLMVGRDLMKDMGMAPQCAMTLPLLVGTDGTEKMSKSYGNHIGVNMDPFEMYSRVLSLPDGLMKGWYTLLTLLPPDEIDRLCDGEKTHPKAAKDRLAREVAAAFHSRDDVDTAADRWEQKFAQKKVIDVQELVLEERTTSLVALLRATGIPASNGEARRLIEQGGVELDGARMNDPRVELELKEGAILRVGKKRKFFRVSWS